MRAKDVADVMGLQSQYLNRQMQALSAQVQELGQSAAKMPVEAAKPKPSASCKFAICPEKASTSQCLATFVRRNIFLLRRTKKAVMKTPNARARNRNCTRRRVSHVGLARRAVRPNTNAI
jgi:hypothetical protein